MYVNKTEFDYFFMNIIFDIKGYLFNSLLDSLLNG